MRWDVFFSCFINSFAIVYVSNKLMNRTHVDKKKLFASLLILGIYIYFSYMLTQNFIRTILLFVIIILVNIFIDWKKDHTFNEEIITSFIIWLVMLFTEICFTIIIFGVFKLNLENFYFEFFKNTIANFIIMVSFIIVSTNSYVLPRLKKIIVKYGNVKKYNILTITVLSAISVSLIFYLCYFKFNIFFTFSMCFIIVLIYTYMIYSLFEEKEKKTKVERENEMLDKRLNEYEKMYQKQRMINHEHKNELSIIRGQINKSNKKLIKYIDDIIDLKEKNNDKWMEKLKQLPEGGLQGLLYYKMTTMEEKEIEANLEINRNVNTRLISNIDSDLIQNVCKILGVFLDNAIQAVETLPQKHIQVSIYADELNNNNLVISVMNNFGMKVELDRINEIGYSTKGKGRGLGLAIVQEILKKEKRITNRTKVIRNNFMQELNIETKK